MEEKPIDLEPEQEDPLCSLFGTDSRFVRFINDTGRPIRVTSRLQIHRLPNQAWSTTRLLLPGTGTTWRFLGDDIPEPAMAVLALLPDPYTLARENSYVWTADFVDSTETADILFNKKSGSLDLSSMRVLNPGEKLEVVLQRKEGVASLASLARDLLARLQLEVDNLPEDHLPGNLKRGLVKLTKDYEEIDKPRLRACDRCQEEHVFPV